MSNTLRTGLWIGVLTVLWMLVMGYTGWYLHPALLNLFFLVIVIEVVLISRALRRSAATNTYLQQVVAGTTMAVVAAAVIFCGSYLFTTVLFPTYFQDLQRVGREVMAGQGLPDTEITRRLEAMAPWQTPVMNALQGVIGTVLTGLVTALIVGAFSRKRA